MDPVQDKLKSGWKHHQEGELDLARQCYWSVLATDYLHGNALQLLGRLEFDAGSPEKALSYMEQAVASEPTNAAFQHNLGLVYVNLGKVDDARACFAEAIRLKPDYAEAHNNLGNILAGMGDLSSAIGHYRQALVFQPGFADARHNLELALEPE